MLDPWIIEEIKRREQQRSRIEQQPRIEAPVHGPERDKGGGAPKEDDPPRGVAIIDFGVACW